MTENNQPTNENKSSTHDGATNFYAHTEKQQEEANPNYMKSHVFRVPFRTLIVASSGAGKSNSVLNIIQKMGPTFVKVNLCVPVPDEPLYNLLKDKLKDKLEIYTGEIKSSRKNAGAQPNIPKLDDIAQKDLDGWTPQLMIFDDLMLYTVQDEIEKYFVRARKKNISSIYVAQSFFKTPITIRRNVNYIILKRNVLQSDLKKIFNVASLDINFTQFLQFYRDATSTMEDFLLIDLEKSALFKNFSTTPLYSTYEYEAQVAKAAEEAAPEHKQFEPEERKYSQSNQDNIMRDFGVATYIKILQDNRVGVPVSLQELHAKYSEFANDSNHPISGKHYFSRRLGLAFEKRKGRDGQAYFLI
jgi:hypothetical protein